MNKEVIDFVVAQNLGFNLGNDVQLICQANACVGEDAMDKLLVASSHIEHYIERNERVAVLKKAQDACKNIYMNGGCKYCPVGDLVQNSAHRNCKSYIAEHPHEAMSLLGGKKL